MFGMRIKGDLETMRKSYLDNFSKRQVRFLFGLYLSKVMKISKWKSNIIRYALFSGEFGPNSMNRAMRKVYLYIISHYIECLYT